MVLKLKNLSKAFQDKEILNGFSYNFEESGLYFIVGESGVGKTTLLRIIAGLDREYDGTVENGGAKNISFMFQEYRLFPTLGALKNAAISNENNINKAHALLSRLGFEENDMKKKPRELSGGMKQRVAFARAVLKPAPILILDEPTKELDFETVATIHEVIAEEAKKRLVIVVTHDDITDFLASASVIRL